MIDCLIYIGQKDKRQAQEEDANQSVIIIHDTLMGQINNILLYILGVTNYMLKFGGKD
jgi:hypothetical protein